MAPDRGQPSARSDPAAVREPPPQLFSPLRLVHLHMVEAVLHGDGLERVAAIAAEHAAAPVAIVVPRSGLAVAAQGWPRAALGELTSYASARIAGRPAPVPAGVALEAPITAGDELVGIVAARRADATAPPLPSDTAELLHLAAVVSLTELAVLEAREDGWDGVRGSLLEELRDVATLDGASVTRRAARLGCDLSAGALLLCSTFETARPRHVIATVVEGLSGTLAQVLGRRVYALVPLADSDGAEAVIALLERRTGRLRRPGVVGLSAVCRDPVALHRALHEAELMHDLLTEQDEPPRRFRALAEHPETLTQIAAETVVPLARYDEQYDTELLPTVATALRHEGDAGATAATLRILPHVVAYRFDRIEELTGLDARRADDRRRLGHGLRAHRLAGGRAGR